MLSRPFLTPTASPSFKVDMLAVASAIDEEGSPGTALLASARACASARTERNRSTSSCGVKPGRILSSLR